MVTLIVGYTIIGNNQRMKELEGDIQTMKNIFEKDPVEKDPVEVVKGNASGKDNSVEASSEFVDSKQLITPTSSPTDKPIEITPTTSIVEPTTTPTVTIEPTPTESPITSFKPDQLVEYTIKEGDTLASISLRECGNYNYLSVIKELNTIENENIIYVGQVILIPKKN